MPFCPSAPRRRVEWFGVNSRGSYPLGKEAPERRPEQIGPCKHEAGRHLKEQQKKQQAHPDAGQRVMPNMLLRFTCQERCDIGSDSRSEAGATGKNGAPSRVPIAKECPKEPPKQIRRHDVPERDMNTFQQDLACRRNSKRVVLKITIPVTMSPMTASALIQ
jgi:hypothetical protein